MSRIASKYLPSMYAAFSMWIPPPLMCARAVFDLCFKVGLRWVPNLCNPSRFLFLHSSCKHLGHRVSMAPRRGLQHRDAIPSTHYTLPSARNFLPTAAVRGSHKVAGASQRVFIVCRLQAVSEAGESVTEGLGRRNSKGAVWPRKAEVLEQVRCDI